MHGFSRRSRPGSDTNALTRALAQRGVEAREQGNEDAPPLLDLTNGNPTALGLGWEADALAPLLAPAGTERYQPEPFGLMSARAVLSEHLAQVGVQVAPAELLLTASTSEAYAFLFKLLCDAGDNVLVPSPSYPLFDMLAALEGVELRPYALRYDGRWHLDLPTLEAARDARTRAILLVHPNNPTGSYLSREELARLAAFDLPLVSDEVFAEYAHRPDPRRAASAWAARERVLVFRMGGLSKSLALPQLKLAWTAIGGPAPRVREACERLSHIADTYLSVATPVQLALPALLARGAQVRAELHARVLRNLRQLETTFAGSAVSVLDCEGGWYAILRLPSFLDDEQWALTLLRDHDVLVQPGFYYELQHGACVVVSLLSHEGVLREGARRIVRAVEDA
jgi:aspartate/methionine/tyrosine aminotransferase